MTNVIRSYLRTMYYFENFVMTVFNRIIAIPQLCLLFCDPCTFCNHTCQDFLSFSISWSLLKYGSIESVMPIQLQISVGSKQNVHFTNDNILNRKIFIRHSTTRKQVSEDFSSLENPKHMKRWIKIVFPPKRTSTLSLLK